MDKSWWFGDRPRRGRLRRRGRPSIALVEFMERRDLLTVTMSPISPTAGQVFTGLVATFAPGGSLAGTKPSDFATTIAWDQSGTPASQTPGAIFPDPSTPGVFDVIGAFTYARPGPTTVSVTVTGTAGSKDGAFENVVVKDAALTVYGLNVSAKANTSVTGSVAEFLSASSTAKASDFVATIDWGDGSTVDAPGSVTANPQGGFLVGGSHTYKAPGSYTTKVTVRDSQGSAPAVGDGSAPVVPTSAVLAPVSQLVVAPAGQAIPASTVVGSFTDTNLVSAAGDFTAAITWSSGNTSQGKVVKDAAKSNAGANWFDVEGSNTYVLAGKYTPTINVQDSSGDSTTINSMVVATGPQIAATGTVVSPTAGVPFSGVVATFTDSNPSDAGLAAVIDWGDGLHTSLGTIAPTAGGFKVTGSNTYATAKLYKVTVTISDAVGQQATANGTAVVEPATALTPVPIPVSAAVGQPVPIGTVVGAFYDSDAASVPADFQAVIDWGDKHTTLGRVIADPALTGGGVNGFEVVVMSGGQDTYVAAGSYTAAIAVQDNAGDSTTIKSPVAVTSAAITAIGTTVFPVVNRQFTGVVATFVDQAPLDAGALTAAIAWGDGHASAGSVIALGGGNYQVVGTNTYANVGTAAITVTIAAPGNRSATATSMATVVSPSLSATGATFAVVPGQPVAAVVARFVDTDPAGASAVINWGDGDTSVGSIVADPNIPGTFDVLGGGYAYPTAGSTGLFTVAVTITDAIGQKATATSTSVVTNVAPSLTFAGALVTSPGVGLPGNTVDTNTGRPTFGGTAAPFSTIQLFARLDGIDATIPLGQTVAGTAGQWSLTVGPLLDGYYAVTATVTPPGGYPTAGLPLANNSLVVIDTAPPVLDSVLLQRNGNQVVVTFSDGLSGMNLGSVLNRANYAFVGPRGQMVTPVAVALRSSGVLPTDPVSVMITTTLNPRLRGRLTLLRIINSGITDLAGNQLLGTYRGVLAPLVKASRHVVRALAPGRRR